ncbi:radical SAM protein [Clostridiaceae bacterium M8S5]|nr:radical SAM protein [Clostridiaceae bacterium M8S5]
MGEVVSKASGILYHPLTISVHMTDLCNSKCKFCSEASHEHTYDFVREKDIIKFLQSHNTSEWTALNIHGGEPTLSASLLKVVRCARNLGYSRIILQTNAHRIGTDKTFAIALNESGIDLYNIGFHGSKREIMDKLTGVHGSFDKALRGIRTISGFRKPIRITVVICAHNYKDISAIVLLVAKEEIAHINISAMQTGGSAMRNIESLFVSYSKARPYLEEAVCIAKSLGIKVTFEGFPYCVLKGMENYQVDWKAQRLKVLYRKIIIDDFNKFLTQTIRMYGPPCENCEQRVVCSGVYSEYANRNGWSEFDPYVVKEV